MLGEADNGQNGYSAGSREAGVALSRNVFKGAGTSKRDDGREDVESLSVRGIAPTQILSELTIKERRGIQTWRRAQQQDTSCCSHSFASFRGFQKDPSVEGGERRVDGAHQRRRGRGAKPGRGGSDAVSRRSSPGILLSLRAERALRRGAGVKRAKLRAPLPGADFQNKSLV